jgi:hypothetical protein
MTDMDENKNPLWQEIDAFKKDMRRLENDNEKLHCKIAELNKKIEKCDQSNELNTGARMALIGLYNNVEIILKHLGLKFEKLKL